MFPLSIKHSLIDRQLNRPEVRKKISLLRLDHGDTPDPWGLDLKVAEKIYALALYLYEDWFRVETQGIQHIPEGRCILVANHSGQLPLDGAMISCATVREMESPRIVRGMVEKFAMKTPFVNTFMARSGMVVGNPENCQSLLENENLILVFPEGVRGSGKTFDKRYQLQTFGLGFLRLALKTKTPIVPISVIGAEETYPSFWDGGKLAKKLGLPYFPFTPFFPWLGLAGLVPLPSKIRLQFHEPILFEGDPDESEDKIKLKVTQVKRAIEGGFQQLLPKRSTIIGG